jgi:hypothetical protein
MATQGAWQATQALWTLPASVAVRPIDGVTREVVWRWAGLPPHRFMSKGQRSMPAKGLTIRKIQPDTISQRMIRAGFAGHERKICMAL